MGWEGILRMLYSCDCLGITAVEKAMKLPDTMLFRPEAGDESVPAVTRTSAEEDFGVYLSGMSNLVFTGLKAS